MSVVRMSPTIELLTILRETLRSLEQSEEVDSHTMRQLKRSILRSIAELELLRSENPKKCA